MKVAIISDIHANVVALKAVLKDIEEQQVDRIYCVGDLVGYAPFPNEVIDLIKEKNIPTVMGNYDDGIGYRPTVRTVLDPLYIGIFLHLNTRSRHILTGNMGNTI